MHVLEQHKLQAMHICMDFNHPPSNIWRGTQTNWQFSRVKV